MDSVSYDSTIWILVTFPVHFRENMRYSLKEKIQKNYAIPFVFVLDKTLHYIRTNSLIKIKVYSK